MTGVLGLRCVRCSQLWKQGEVEYTCPRCSVDGILDVEYDYEQIEALGFGARSLLESDEDGVWRYESLLPVSDRRLSPPLRLGPTPLYRFDDLAAEFGVAAFYVKDDGSLPTGSFKDRASWIGVTRARELGYEEIACASTGNAASSLAGMCASVGLRAHIFVPASVPEAKLAQLQVFGADTILVAASYDEAYDLCAQACQELDWYNRNCATNPYLVEGKKTAGLELAEQLPAEMPDWLAVAVGDGCTIAGIWKGLCEMHRFGVCERLPRLLGVQAASCAPLVHAFETHSEIVGTEQGLTRADSIAVGKPRNAVKALRAVRESGGSFVAVEDDEILAAQRHLARRTGVFAEPAGAAAVAAVRRARGDALLDEADRVAIIVTGNGLKDIRAVTDALARPEEIPCDLGAVLAGQVLG